jgi:Ca2+-binding EF-hand superfamily protein
MDRPVIHSALSASTSRRQLLAFMLASCVAAPTAAFARGGSFEAIGRNVPGVIDLDEAKRAAELLFQRLDRHQTGKLTRAQLGRRRLTVAEFSWADRDHDGTLDKDEYLALVERQFRAADVDQNGVVSRDEFASTTGLPLRRLLY